ncbi:hypothetical protein PP178_08410 [Zeaxanthinibacter sp. PT1]|uniref:hypothetical protein n=1 Tax=Zeaxanthinibacter TaxID=561554 RepID=UPI00234BF6DC|nr:hypothetical protein [Zeaxanthinibacter sp. PT1]MDC6351576.1 hypothetical protein [Zeaxanthinibacter sp. PT1]
MKIQILNAGELLSISGGNDSDYNMGYAIGEHIRSGFKSLGDFLESVSSILSPID